MLFMIEHILNGSWCTRCKTTGGPNQDLLVGWPGRRYKAFKTGTLPAKTGVWYAYLLFN